DADLREDQRGGEQEQQRDRHVSQQILGEPERVEQERREQDRDEEGDGEPGDDRERAAAVLARASGEHDREHRQDARRNRRDQPRHEREDDREDHRWLFGRRSLPGCYGFIVLRGRGLAAVLLRAALDGLRGRGRRLLLAPPATPPSRVRLRRREVVGEGGGDLVDRAEALAGGLEVVVRAGRVAVGGGEQGRGGSDRQILGGGGQLDRVLLVPLAARVRERAEQPLGLGVLGAGLAVEHLAHCTRESPGPARQDLVGRVGFPLADRAQ